MLGTRQGRRRRDHPWRRAARWPGRIIFSPPVVLREVLLGRGQLGSEWVRAFLILGTLLLAALGGAILASQASERQVFAALGNFDPPSEPLFSTEQYAAEVNAAASHYGLNPMAVYCVIQIESHGRPRLVSVQGACGLMQIMPRTWRALNPVGICRADHEPAICRADRDCIFAPWGNISTGTLYLSRLLRANHGDYVAALQAYNAGQQNVVFAPQARYPETRQYVAGFLQLYRHLQERYFEARLRVSRQSRQWVMPLFIAVGFYFVLAAAFFWRRHRRLY